MISEPGGGGGEGGGGGGGGGGGSKYPSKQEALSGIYGICIIPHPLGLMCCLPLIRCTVHRPCCMICNRGSKEKVLQEPCLFQFQGLLCFKGTIGLTVVRLHLHL